MINTFTTAIEMEQNRIQRFIDLSQPSAAASEAGSLQLEQRGNGTFCYERWYGRSHQTSKKYLGRLCSDGVRSHIKDRYLAERLSRLQADQKLLKELTDRYKDYGAESIIASLPKSYRTAAAALSGADCGAFNYFDRRYEELRQWANDEYPKNTAPFPAAVNLTKTGVRVRSKGECIHFNQFSDLAILFRYDCLLKITDPNGNTKELSPDFLIKCFDGTLIIIEHLGRIGDKGYAIDFGEKCYWYLQAGFVLGKDFFVTSDDPNGGTDSRQLLETDLHVQKLFFGF